MKNIITILLLTMSMTTYSQKHYAPLNAEWKYEGQSYDCTGAHRKFKVESELSIQNKDCSVIKGYFWKNDLGEWTENEDSLIVWEDERKVYFLEDSIFYLLYDFTADVGDTIEFFDPINKGLFSSTFTNELQSYPNKLYTKIDSIEIVNIGSQSLNKFHTTALNELNPEHCTNLWSIIENIGSTSMGITGEPCELITLGCFGQIVCYKNDFIEYYSGFLDCELFTLNDEKYINENNLIVFPNPAQNEIYFRKIGDIEPRRVELFDMNGKLLYTKEYVNCIEIKDLNSGIYILSITFKNNQQIIKKIVKK